MRDLNDFITFLVKGEKEINESFKSKSKNNLSPEQVATQKQSSCSTVDARDGY